MFVSVPSVARFTGSKIDQRLNLGFRCAPPQADMIGVGRAIGFVPPPSEPDGRFSRIRLSSWWFTQLGVDATEHGRRRKRTAPAQQSMHWTSADDQHLARAHVVHYVYAGRCASGSVLDGLAARTCNDGCV